MSFGDVSNLSLYTKSIPITIVTMIDCDQLRNLYTKTWAIRVIWGRNSRPPADWKRRSWKERGWVPVEWATWDPPGRKKKPWPTWWFIPLSGWSRWSLVFVSGLRWTKPTYKLLTTWDEPARIKWWFSIARLVYQRVGGRWTVPVPVEHWIPTYLGIKNAWRSFSNLSIFRN